MSFPFYFASFYFRVPNSHTVIAGFIYQDLMLPTGIKLRIATPGPRNSTHSHQNHHQRLDTIRGEIISWQTSWIHCAHEK